MAEPRYYFRLRVRPQMPVQAAGGGTVLLTKTWRTIALYETEEASREGLRGHLAKGVTGEKAIISHKSRQVFPFNPPKRASDTRCDACRSFPKTDGLRVWCGCAEGRAS